MSLHLRDIGIATAYATVGVGEVTAEMNSAVKAVNRLRSELKNPKTLHTPETIFLLGQADVATMFETSNFKRVFDLRYPRVESHAAVVNWVFSVPYEGGRDHEPTGQNLFRFILHVRLRRAAYWFTKLEHAIVDKLWELLGDLKKDARIHVGLGWSDLVIDGFFRPQALDALATFMIQLHGIKVRYGTTDKKELPVLQRMLTVLGYTGDPPRSPGTRHLTLIRTKPAEYNNAEAILREYGTVYMLDGKADFMIVTSGEKADANWLVRQRALGEKDKKETIRKVETHLMMFPAAKFRKCSESESLYIDIEQDFDRERCGCDTVSKNVLAEIDTRMEDLRGRKLLPNEQRYAIDNTLFLLEASLRDASTCCDMRDAVLASYDGLLTVLRALDRADRGLAGDMPHKHIVADWRRLDEWHRFTELLLRQRTVGSYEEILGQSDRSVVYSGGVQKFLYLADQLLADFARFIGGENAPRFVTIYDSVKTILSFRTGVVRVPTSLIFSFPFVVPQLWHEVAGTLFFLRLGKQISHLTPSNETNEFLTHLADHYADILVYLYGFRADFERFIASLMLDWTSIYGDLADTVRTQTIGQLLLRTYLIYEFDQVRQLHTQGSAAKAKKFIQSEETIDRLTTELRALLQKRQPDVAKLITDEHWKQLRRNARTEDFSAFHRNLYARFVQVDDVKPLKHDLARFRRGEIVPLDDTYDLNGLFGELAYQMITTPRKRSHFRAMASLGKSAAIEFHRRQIAKRAPSEPRPARTPAKAADLDLTPVMSPRADTYPPRPLAAGEKILKRFEVKEHLGSGAMGEVYLVKDLKLGGHIALKFARVDAGPYAEQQLVTELKLGRVLTHENICQVYEFGDFKGRFYIAMEYVREDLAKRIKRQVRVPIKEAIELAYDIFAGLAKLESKGIVHRDLKPSNVLIDESGSAKISDCGLAILEDTDRRADIGTLLYMAPEQILGVPASFQTDVYSAGLVVFEMFTGERAIKATTVAQLAQSHLAAQNAKPSALVPPAQAKALAPLDALIMKSIVDDPAQRPKARELRDLWAKVVRARRKKPKR